MFGEGYPLSLCGLGASECEGGGCINVIISSIITIISDWHCHCEGGIISMSISMFFEHMGIRHTHFVRSCTCGMGTYYWHECVCVL